MTVARKERRCHSSISQGKITVLQDRYKISSDKILGEGGFAKVYRGLDTKECRGVAVKVYTESDDVTFQSFKKSVEVLTRLNQRDRRGSLTVSKAGSEDFAPCESFKPGLLESTVGNLSTISGADGEHISQQLLNEMSFADCFVDLIDFSKDENGDPDLDITTELYFLVFELGEESLDNVISTYSDEGQSFSLAELRNLHWSLVSIVCGLHHEGYVHMDIKPMNIMRFSRAKGDSTVTFWKLIDLDGAMKTGKKVAVKDIVFTPQYMAPELAEAVYNYSQEPRQPPPKSPKQQEVTPQLRLSRLMDIWSVGMCALEAIFLTPVLDPWYNEWREETGGEGKFLKWLGDLDGEPIISGEMADALTEVHADLCSFLTQMLARDPAERCTITECLSHSWLQPVRQELQEDIDKFVNSKLRKQTSDETGVESCARSSDAGTHFRGSILQRMAPDITVRTAKAKLIEKGLTSKACSIM